MPGGTVADTYYQPRPWKTLRLSQIAAFLDSTAHIGEPSSHRNFRSVRSRLRKVLEHPVQLSDGALALGIRTLALHNGSRPPQIAFEEMATRTRFRNNNAQNALAEAERYLEAHPKLRNNDLCGHVCVSCLWVF